MKIVNLISLCIACIVSFAFTEVSETVGIVCDAKNSNECKIITKDYTITATGRAIHFTN